MRLRRFLPLVLLLCAGAAMAVGCGDKKKSTQPNPGIDVKDGIWRLHIISAVTGDHPSCQVTPDTLTEDMPLCSFDAGDASGDTGDDDCTYTMDGDNATIFCETITQSDPCTFHEIVTATGTFTSTSFTLDAMTYQIVEGPLEMCPADPCTTSLHITGAWNSVGGDCPSAPSGYLPLSRVVRGVVGAAR